MYDGSPESGNGIHRRDHCIREAVTIDDFPLKPITSRLSRLGTHYSDLGPTAEVIHAGDEIGALGLAFSQG